MDELKGVVWAGAGEVGAVPVVVMAIADREDPDAAPFRAEHKVECLVTLSEIRAS